MKKQRKRFIAGATCPKCGALDSIMLYFENNVEKLQCHQCDYHDTQTQDQVDQSTRESESVIGVFKP